MPSATALTLNFSLHGQRKLSFSLRPFALLRADEVSRAQSALQTRYHAQSALRKRAAVLVDTP